jgi:hypothetical protein
VTEQINPPFDGSAPCAMCNQDLRNASALIHNMLNRWPDSKGKAMVKLNDLRVYWKRPAQLAVSHPAVTELLDVADALVEACSGMVDEGTKIRWPEDTLAKVDAVISRARRMNDEIEKLSESHFHDRRHCSGDENVLREQRGYSRLGGEYNRTVEVVPEGGDLRHTVCDTRVKLNAYFKSDLDRDPKFFGKVWCPCCRSNLPFAQFEAVVV